MACLYTGDPCGFPDSDDPCTWCSGCHNINCEKCQNSEQRWYAGMPYYFCLIRGAKIRALNNICSSFKGNCMLCAHVEKPEDPGKYWYYKCKLKAQKPIDDYGHIDPTKAKVCAHYKSDGTYKGWEQHLKDEEERRAFDEKYPPGEWLG